MKRHRISLIKLDDNAAELKDSDQSIVVNNKDSFKHNACLAILQWFKIKSVPDNVHRFEQELKQFLEEEHLPDVYAFKLVESHKLYRLLEQDDSESITLCLQYFLPDMGTYRQHEELLDYSFKNQIKKQN